MDNFTLYSFDIFDTLITRKVATPNGIFVLAQHALQGESCSDIPSDLRASFHIVRKSAESYLRKVNNMLHDDKEIRFDEIYSHIQHTYYLSEIQTEKLIC